MAAALHVPHRRAWGTALLEQATRATLFLSEPARPDQQQRSLATLLHRGQQRFVDRSANRGARPWLTAPLGDECHALL
eukprot:883680-Prymnesium_polylepis.1